MTTQGIYIKLQEEALVFDTVFNQARDEKAGGIATFVGTVRNQTQGKKVLQLRFEAYEAMAQKELEKLAQEACNRWDIFKLAITHRLGTVYVGEIVVVIVVSTAHRKAAFEACQFLIDTLKETVPIWKKEYFEDGEVWVAAHP